jgi:hypothetical protein
MSPEEHIAKLNAQVGALNLVVLRMDARTASTHRVVVASSIVGPPHRANLGLSMFGILIGAIALAVALGACQ